MENKIWKIGCLMLALLVLTSGVVGVVSADIVEYSNNAAIECYDACALAFESKFNVVVSKNDWTPIIPVNDWWWDSLYGCGINSLSGDFILKVSSGSKFDPPNEGYEIRIVAVYHNDNPPIGADKDVYIEKYSSGFKNEKNKVFSSTFDSIPRYWYPYPPTTLYQYELNRVELQLKGVNLGWWWDDVKIEHSTVRIWAPPPCYTFGEFKFNIPADVYDNFVNGEITVWGYGSNPIDDDCGDGNLALSLNNELISEEAAGIHTHITKDKIKKGENIVKFIPNGTNRKYRIEEGDTVVTIVYNPPKVDLSPSSHNYGSVEVGSCSSEYSFTLTNTGGGTATGSVSLTRTHASQFTITQGSGSFSLGAGSSKTIKVKFCPASTGSKSANLYADGTNCNDDTSSLSGTGTQPQRTITFYADPTDGGTITFDGSAYSNGQSTTKTDGTYSVSTNPASNYEFDHWSTTGGVSVANSYSQSTTAAVSGDGSIKAWFNYVLPEDTTPPTWDTTVGIQSATDTGKGGEVTVTYGTATDADSPPVKYNVYYSTSSPATAGTKLSNVGSSPYTVTGLTNGKLYYFTVRVEDSATPPNEDTNTVELTATPTAPDTIPPTITSVSPTNESINVPVITTISATFSEVMNKTSAEAVFSITPSVAGTFSWTGNTMTFTPTANLADSTTYTVTIAATATDLAGNGLDDNANGIAEGSPTDDYTWSFTTKEMKKYGVNLSCANPEMSIPPKGYALYDITVKNTGNMENIIKLEFPGIPLPPLSESSGTYSIDRTIGEEPLPTLPLPPLSENWGYSLDRYNVDLLPGESTVVVLNVSDNSDERASAGSSCEVKVTGTSQGDPTRSDYVITNTTIKAFDWNPWNNPDSDGGEKITTTELQEAIHCWLNDEPAPKTDAEITTERLQEVIHQWLVG